MSNSTASEAAYNLTLPIKHLIKRPPVFVSPGASVAAAASAMQQAAIGSLLVADDPPGIVTDRDLRGRVLAVGLGPETPVSLVMTRPLKTLHSESPAFVALQMMLENNIHHLPITDEAKIIGIVSGTDLLLHEMENPLYLRRSLEELEDPSALGNYAELIGELVGKVFNGGVSACEIGRIVSSLNDALLRRLYFLAAQDLGPPPTPFAWIVFGSEGRLEQTLLTDQDNALVYGDDSAAAQRYFPAFAEYIVQGLIKVGFPSCPGGYMATQWCKPLTEWRALFTRCMRDPEPKSVLNIAIFLDFRCIFGDLSLNPLEEAITSGRHERLFLSRLLKAALEFRPPLGFFNRLCTQSGKVDLKKGGLGPIVALARAAALRAGSHERSTLARLKAAGASGAVLNVETARTLADIFTFLLHIRLRRQLAARRQGEPLDHAITLAELSTLERRHLKEAFVMIKQIQEDIRSAAQLDLLS